MDTKETHIMLLRHFKTKDDVIIYNKCVEQATRLFRYISKYVKKNNIENINIYISPKDRTVITGLFMYITLKNIENVNVNLPIINKHLNRDPSKKHKHDIIKYFKNLDHTNNLTLYISHSSSCANIFNGLLQSITNKKPDKTYNKVRLHSLSISTITYKNDKLKFQFNQQL